MHLDYALNISLRLDRKSRSNKRTSWTSEEKQKILLLYLECRIIDGTKPFN